MHALVLVLSFATLLSTAAFAQTEATTPSPPATAGTEQPAAEKIICIDENAGGNSRLGSHRVCHTQKEWESVSRTRR